MLQSKPTFAILLALSFLFSEAHGFLSRETIGYASVTAEQGQRINDNKNKLQLEQTQDDATLGAGFTLLNDLDRLEHIPGNWYCAIRAKKSRTRSISKVYIPQYWPTPESFSMVTLWGAPDEVILNYIITKALVTEPAEALRFSWVEGMERQLQMLIPASVVQNDAAFGLRAKCSKEKNDVRGYRYLYKPVNWEDKEYWDIRGVAGLAPVRQNR
ncbi:hypothetical protein LZ554_004409 [Drepanopeziza brunnea f. sp. 'monogermtubi']|nr:hypothetical protein LZ554_004409 [Drepanopeziza brunnea f. sp. 'monogermtubi']